MRICDYPGCGRKHECNGLCHSHQAQLNRGRGLSPIRTKLGVLDRFWSRVDMSGECWIWTGASRCSGGRYGAFGYQGVNVAAHRFMWELYNGPIAPGMVICHTCDVTKCVNPSHLFEGTQRDNVADMRAKGRQVDPHGERARLAKLTNEQALAIRSDTRPVHEVADEYGVTVSTIYRVWRRETWKLI